MAIEWSRHRAVLFDLDGVLTPTAVVHRRAWAETFDQFLTARGLPRFTDDDYLAHVDGKPRYDGVRDFLASRQISLPEGSATDAPGWVTVQALGNLKNDMFNTVLTRDGVEPYPGSMRLLDHLAGIEVAAAVVSSSANAMAVLEAAGLEARFPVVVDGVVAGREHLAGKPSPDTFLRAAELLGATPPEAVVVEDARSGVQAGRAGGFGLVVGVARHGGAEELAEAGADVVVADLADTLA